MTREFHYGFYITLKCYNLENNELLKASIYMTVYKLLLADLLTDTML